MTKRTDKEWVHEDSANEPDSSVYCEENERIACQRRQRKQMGEQLK
jgi:hypothetical protein